jgi:hypothetical protein
MRQFGPGAVAFVAEAGFFQHPPRTVVVRLRGGDDRFQAEQLKANP